MQYPSTPNNIQSILLVDNIQPLDMLSVGGNEMDLFQSLSTGNTGFIHHQPSNGFLPLFAPLNNFPSDNAVCCMTELPTKRKEDLSLDIQPCISITEPTPVSSLGFVDQFIVQHSTQLEHANLLDDLLLLSSPTNTTTTTTTTTHPWTNWTPIEGSLSPVSFTGAFFDDQYSISSTPDNDPSLCLISQNDFSFMSSFTGSEYSSPSLSFNGEEEEEEQRNSKDTLLTVVRQVSESLPPKQDFQLLEFQLQQQCNTNNNKSKRRVRSKTMNSSSTNHACPHPGCGKLFTRPYNLTSHMRTHTAERPFACSECGRRFARQHDRNRHEKLHWGIKPYACLNCKKPFARMDALNRHLRVENGCQNNTMIHKTM